VTQKKILLDSNSYFRLAKSIHPLLDTIYGEENYCLYVLKELNDEFDRSRRLQDKFEWVNEDEYVENRSKRLSLSNKNKKAISTTVELLQQHKIENCLGVSKIDIQCLAYGFVLEVPVVTDDGDMIQLAKDFDIEILKTLNLMSVMVVCEHISMDKVRQIVAYWKYIQDKPGNFRGDYIAIFKEDPP